MRAMVWQYQSETKQEVYFRGRVREYRGVHYHDWPCSEVRLNRIAALNDAKQLLKKLSKIEHEKVSF